MADKKKTRKTETPPKKTGKNAAKSKAAKPPSDSPPTNAKVARLSALDAAARILGETRKAMTCAELIQAMAAKGYWTSPAGKTPPATLYSALLRELQTKGKDARFRKTEPGKFTLA
jgi:hypothetical protein